MNEFKEYFEKFGYKYSWDFSRKNNSHWHELYKDGGLIIQIESGIPLQKIISDLKNCYKNPNYIFNYFIGCDDDEVFDKFIEDTVLKNNLATNTI